jgi:hypothetical protein
MHNLCKINNTLDAIISILLGGKTQLIKEFRKNFSAQFVLTLSGVAHDGRSGLAI